MNHPGQDASPTAGRARSTARSLWRQLSQLALKGAAVNAKPAGGLGDVASAVGQHTVDVLPLGAGQRRRVVRVGRRFGQAGVAPAEGRQYLVGIGRLREVI